MYVWRGKRLQAATLSGKLEGNSEPICILNLSAIPLQAAAHLIPLIDSLILILLPESKPEKDLSGGSPPLLAMLPLHTISEVDLQEETAEDLCSHHLPPKAIGGGVGCGSS